MDMSFFYRKDKHQYLEVNFNSKVKIRRLSTKGLYKNYVKSLSLFYSDDGNMFKHYKPGRGIEVKNLLFT